MSSARQRPSRETDKRSAEIEMELVAGFMSSAMLITKSDSAGCTSL